MFVAVYGSLLSGLYNHDRHLKNAELIGQFQSEPVYNLYDLRSFPGLTKGGNTSVTMEIYDVNDVELSNLDRLEGYNPNNPENSFYTRELIQTPYGEAFCYFYNHNLNEKVGTIKHGNWRLHSTTVKRK